MEPSSPTGRLRAWLREAVGTVRDAVAEPPEPQLPSPVAGGDAAPPEVRDALGAQALVGDGGLIACWQPVRAELDAAIDAFVAGRPVAVAVVGAAGSGREVLLDHAERRVRRADAGTLTTRIDAPPAGLLHNELETDLPDVSPRRQAVLVSGAHRAYRRRIGGFDDLQASLDLLSDTVDRILWVVEFDAVPWSFLDRVYEVSAHFSHVLEVPPLSAEDLHLALQRRLVALAGRARFLFPPPPDLPLEEHPGWTNGGYAARLHLASRGNPQAAGELVWRHLEPTPAADAFAVQAPPPLSLSDLGAVSPQHVIALELLLGQGALTPEDLAELLVLAPSEARSVLEGLVRLGLVQGDRHRGYAVDPVWRAPLVDHLQSKNLL